jgi:hypothetical protein
MIPAVAFFVQERGRITERPKAICFNKWTGKDLVRTFENVH